MSKRTLALPKVASNCAIIIIQAPLETRPKRKHSTALSRYIWNLKNTNANFSLKWKIIKRCKAYSSRTKRCNLCLYEKLFITLNSRNELISSLEYQVS